MPVDATGPARTVDVRPLEEPPFDAVVDALGDLEAGETVEVVAGVAPVPLYDALEARGWTYESVRVGPDEWHVRVAAAGEDDGDDAGRPGERLRRPRTDRLPQTHS